MSDDSQTWLSARATARSRSVGSPSCIAPVMIAVIAWLTRPHRLGLAAAGRTQRPHHRRSRLGPLAPTPRTPGAGRRRPGRPPSLTGRRIVEQAGTERLHLTDVRLEQQALLAREVAVDGPERDPGLGRDVAHLHRFEPALVREGQGRVEHPSPPGRLVAGQRPVLLHPVAGHPK